MVSISSSAPAAPATGSRGRHRPGRARAHQVQPARVDPVDQHEAGEHRHEEQAGDGRAAQRIGQHVQAPPAAVALGPGRQLGSARLRIATRGRAAPDLPGGNARRAPATTGRPGAPRRPSRHRLAAPRRNRWRIGADADRRHLPDAAAHLEVLKVHRRANAGAVAHGQQVRSPHRDAADGGVLPDPRAQRAQVPGLQRRAGQQVRRRMSMMRSTSHQR